MLSMHELEEGLQRDSRLPESRAHRRAAHKPLPAPVSFGAHVRDAEVIPHDLGGYDE